MLFIVMPLLIVSCNDHNKSGESESMQNQPEKLSQNAVNPKVNIKVNKKYDDNGNLIGYDSTYTWTYSNPAGDSVEVNADTVLSRFEPFMKERLPLMNDPFYNNMFLNDTNLYNSFFNRDYYLNLWEQENKHMNKIFSQMDSVKNEFFRKNYPGLQKENGTAKQK